ncbi:hypothetical protein [Actinomadura sp. 6N118]|uniref:hypothetical protein n=1 Tax=Actinomadura sp. 6N118 TaxID=3375151 RepID=UPI00379ACC3B
MGVVQRRQDLDPDPARKTADGWQATLHHPAIAGHASLRTHAEGADGNTVDQTTIRAYGIVR